MSRAVIPVQLPGTWAASEVCVVLPTYNEAQNIEEALGRLGDLPLPRLRVIMVDDGSPDGTADVAERFAAERLAERPGFLRVIRRSHKDGLGRAYVAGMLQAISDGGGFVVQMDADLSHAPEYIPQLLGVILSTDAGVVIGSRYAAGGSLADEWQLHRRLLSGWANFYVNAILGLGIRDATAGFKIWRADVLAKIDLSTIRSDGYSFQVEMNHRCQRLGYPLIEVPIHFEERKNGASKMSLRVKLESARMPFTLRLQQRSGRASRDG